MTYDVEVYAGEIKECSANVADENVCSQGDEDENKMRIFDSIVDYRKGINAVDKAEMHLRTKRGQ